VEVHREPPPNGLCVKALRKYEDALQLGSALVVASLTGWRLHTRGWHWGEWLPAAMLACFGVGVLWIIVWFMCRKLTYRQMAARSKADLKAGGDGWPSHRTD
jgi:hypothetical protein